MFGETEPFIGNQYGQILVSLAPKGKGMRTVNTLISAMEPDVLNAPIAAELSFMRISSGPPVTAAINIKIRGDDFDNIRAAVSDLQETLEAQPGIHSIRNNDTIGQSELLLSPDLDAIRRAGLQPDHIARNITRFIKPRRKGIKQ